jgi:SAM-dependent methyltransferase
MSIAKSHSSLKHVGIVPKIREAVTFLQWKSKGKSAPINLEALFGELDHYAATYENYGSKPFSNVRALEIGYGQRPIRLIALTSMGIDANGIDLDTPMIHFDLVRVFQIMKKNGLERALKTAVRCALFDGNEQNALRVALKQRGYEYRLDTKRMFVGDASAYDYGKEKFDFIYSEDVFEHIPPEDVEKIAQRISSLLSPDGVALICPLVFTGISGPHLPEWYPGQVAIDKPRQAEPWEHLRKKRYVANTYLNELPLSAYRSIFSKYLHIVEERVLNPDAGRQWMTPEIRQELAEWSDEELFSNKVEFVLAPKTRAA